MTRLGSRCILAWWVCRNANSQVTIISAAKQSHTLGTSDLGIDLALATQQARSLTRILEASYLQMTLEIPKVRGSKHPRLDAQCIPVGSRHGTLDKALGPIGLRIRDFRKGGWWPGSNRRVCNDTSACLVSLCASGTWDADQSTKPNA